MVVGGNSRTHDHVITKFSRILQVTIFFFARARTSLILILYYGKWLIINSAIFSNSCPVITEMHILKGVCHPTRMREPMKTNLKKLACLFQVLSEILEGCFYLSKSQPSFDS